MKMERVEPAMEVGVPRDLEALLRPKAGECDRGGTAGLLAGTLLLALALPYWLARALVGFAWRDLRRLGRLAGIFGGTYLDALRRRR